MNFDLDRIEFHPPIPPTHDFKSLLFCQMRIKNAPPDKEELIMIKDYESVFVKALVVDGLVPANSGGPFK